MAEDLQHYPNVEPPKRFKWWCALRCRVGWHKPVVYLPGRFTEEMMCKWCGHRWEHWTGEFRLW